MNVSTNGHAGGACRKPHNAIQLTKSPIKHHLKTVHKIISNSEFFCCHTYEFDFSDGVEGWGWGGCTHYVWGSSRLTSYTNIHHL